MTNQEAYDFLCRAALKANPKGNLMPMGAIRIIDIAQQMIRLQSLLDGKEVR